MSAQIIIPIADHDAPLKGEAREAAVLAYRRDIGPLVRQALRAAFNESCSVHGDLGLTDVLREFGRALRESVDRLPAEARAEVAQTH